MSKEIPILFSTPMVQAILEGTKTMTRRTVKQKHIEWVCFNKDLNDDGYEVNEDKCPYGQPGDILWVRESWCHDPFDDDNKTIIYKADVPNGIFKFKPSIHMPKDACRIFLEITSVRVERLQDISEQDAIAEGISLSYPVPFGWRNYLRGDLFLDKEKHYEGYPAAVYSFLTLWASINGIDSWNANPWVWVVEFKKLEGRP